MPNLAETIWTAILSREPERIQAAFRSLPMQDKIVVRAHLIKMTTEEGWQPVQIESASIALNAIKEIPDL